MNVFFALKGSKIFYYYLIISMYSNFSFITLLFLTGTFLNIVFKNIHSKLSRPPIKFIDVDKCHIKEYYSINISLKTNIPNETAESADLHFSYS